MAFRSRVPLDSSRIQSGIGLSQEVEGTNEGGLQIFEFEYIFKGWRCSYSKKGSKQYVVI